MVKTSTMRIFDLGQRQTDNDMREDIHDEISGDRFGERKTRSLTKSLTDDSYVRWAKLSLSVEKQNSQ